MCRYNFISQSCVIYHGGGGLISYTLIFISVSVLFRTTTTWWGGWVLGIIAVYAGEAHRKLCAQSCMKGK